VVDNKPISNPIHELENIFYDMKLKQNIILPDIMFVALLISKLSPYWPDYLCSEFKA